MLLKFKTISKIGLLLIVTLPLLFWVGFLIKQKLIQAQMHEKLESAALQTISLNTSQIIWVTKNREVSINGKLFDVQSVVVIGENTILKGLFDEDEDELITKMNTSFQQKKDSPSPLSQTVFKYLFHPTFIETDLNYTFNNCSLISNKFSVYSDNVPSIYFSIKAPPPKFI